MDAWETIVSFLDGFLAGAILVSGRVCMMFGAEVEGWRG